MLNVETNKQKCDKTYVKVFTLQKKSQNKNEKDTLMFYKGYKFLYFQVKCHLIDKFIS